MNDNCTSYHDAVAEFKRRFLRHALAAHGGNRTRTARAIGLQRTYLLRLIRDFGLTDVAPPSSRNGPTALPCGLSSQLGSNR